MVKNILNVLLRGLFIRPYDVVEILKTAPSDIERKAFTESKREEMFPILKIRKKLHHRSELEETRIKMGISCFWFNQKFRIQI